MFMFYMWLFTTVVGELLRPKPKFDAPQPAGIGQFQVTTAEKGRAVPVVYGQPLLKGPNCTWFGDLRIEPITESVSTGLFSKQTITKGYKYYLGSQLVFCRGFSPGALRRGSGLRELRIDDKQFTAVAAVAPVDEHLLITGITAVKNEASYKTEQVGSDPARYFTRVTIKDEKLFGGEDSGGGFSGVVDFQYGQAAQDRNDYLQRAFSETDIPAYRGYCQAVLRQPYVGTSEYPKQLSAVVCHYPWFWGFDLGHNIDGDANPIAIAVDLLTNRDYGLGYSFAELDIGDSFRAAALTCRAEGVGLSLVYDTQASASDLLEDLLRHIDGVLYADPASGKLKVSLARPDYYLHLLPAFDTSNVISLKMTRSSWADTKNVVKVKYTNREANYQTDVIELKNQANINVRGGERAEDTYEFLGLSNPAAANKVAARVLKTVSTPLARFTINVNRAAFNMHRGSVFKLDWAPLGIANMACRITRISLGDLTDPTIEVDAVEDVFGQLATQITAPPAGSAWVDPSLVDVPANTANRLLEVPHYLAGSADRLAMSLGARSNGQVLGYNLYLQQGGAWAQTATAQPSTPTGVLAAAYPLETAAVDAAGFTVTMLLDQAALKSVSTAERDSGESLLLVDDELMSFASVTLNVDGSVTLGGVVRGVLDTLPAAHASGARVWFISAGAGVVRNTAFEADGAIAARFEPFASRSTGAQSSNVNLTLGSRAARPLPPGNVRLNGLEFPTTLAGDVSLTWAHRSKEALLAARQVPSQDTASTALEAGTTYTVEVLIDGAVVRTATGITGSGFSYTSVTRLADNADLSKPVVFRLKAVKDGLDSAVRSTKPLVMT